jgi:hypothetical protein
MAFVGPAGSGKTYTALKVATAMGGRIALVDTEHGSASKYADKFSFDTLALKTFSPQTHIEAIHAAEQAGYDILIIDSLSHAWMGTGGILNMVDTETGKSKSQNAFTEGWRKATPIHNALVEAILQANLHVIATMRTKTDYVMEKDERTGKTVPKKVGLAPVQRDGLEYEFDIVGDLDIDNNLVITKTRCEALTGARIAKPGEELAKTLKAWLTDGAPAPTPAPVAAQATKVSPATPAPTQNGNLRISPPQPAMEAIRTQIQTEDARPAAPAAVHERLSQKHNEYLARPTPSPETLEKMRGLLVGTLNGWFDDERRHWVLDALWGKKSAKDLNYMEIAATLWLLALKKGDDGKYQETEDSAYAKAELCLLLDEYQTSRGQLTLV